MLSRANIVGTNMCNHFSRCDQCLRVAAWLLFLGSLITTPLARCRCALVRGPGVQLFLIRCKFFFFFSPIIYRWFNWAFAQPEEIRGGNASLLPIWTGPRSLLSPQKKMRLASTPLTLLAGMGGMGGR